MVAIACEWILAYRAWSERAVASACLTIALLLSSCSGRPDIAPVQSFYSEGVPHTDRRGQLRHSFDPKQSFLPLAIYHALAGEHHGAQYELGVLSDAGFNVAHLWEGQMPEAFAARAREAGLQVIVHWPKPESVRALAQHPALLAWYLDEEPSFFTRQRKATSVSRHSAVIGRPFERMIRRPRFWCWMVRPLRRTGCDGTGGPALGISRRISIIPYRSDG